MSTLAQGMQCQANAAAGGHSKFSEAMAQFGSKRGHNTGATPLHYACGKTTANGVIQYLMKQWPEAVRYADSWGRLPLHNACNRVESYNHITTLVVKEARTPLEDIQRLVEQWPESIKVKAISYDRRTPLHYAAAVRLPNEDKTILNWLELPWRDRKRSRQRAGMPEHEEERHTRYGRVYSEEFE